MGRESWAQGKSGITRREFIDGVLVASAGAAVALGAPGRGSAAGRVMDAGPGGLDLWNDPSRCHAMAFGSGYEAPAPGGAVLDAVVVGGGFAGLVAAWRLQEAGVSDVLLLEKNGTVGGQARALEQDGVPVAAMGSAYASPPYNDDLAELYEAVGIVTGWTADGEPVVDPRFLLRPPYARHFIDGAWYDDPWASEAAMDALPYPAPVVAGLRALRDDVSDWWDFVGSDGRSAFGWPPDESTVDPRVRRLDGKTLLEYVRERGWPDETAVFFDPFLRSVFGIGSDRLSAWVALDFLTEEILPGGPDESAICLVGGNAALAWRIEALLEPGTVRTGAFAFRVENRGSLVQVSFLDGDTPRAILCRTAVLACPRLIVPHIVPGLTEETGGGAFGYSTYLVANVHVSRTPEGLAYANEVHGEHPFTDFVVADWAAYDDPSAAPPDRPNILTVYAARTDRRGVGHEPFESIEASILDGLEAVLPGVRDTVTGFDLFRWGHPMVLDEPGFLFSEARIAAGRRVGRILFAGHETVGIPYIDSAITSGFRAASEALELLGRPARRPGGRVGREAARRGRPRRGV